MKNAEIPKRLRVTREPYKAAYDRETIETIIDEAIVCHIGFVRDGQATVIPTLHARVGDKLYIHGSSASPNIRQMATGGVEVCVEMTLLDGLVFARSVFNHSVHYRSVVVYGNVTAVEGAEEKTRALEAFTNKLLPGRWEEARQPSRQELKATSVLVIDLDQASAKVSDLPVDDDEEDRDRECWAGILPRRVSWGPPESAADLVAGIPVPDSVKSYSRQGA